jgi:hypothetical protein
MKDRSAGWVTIPEEMRALDQWCVAGANKAPMSINEAGNLYNASVTQPSDWMPFEQAARFAWANKDAVTRHTDREGNLIEQTGYDVGFVLHQDDPFTCIDLDVKDAQSHPNKPQLWTSPEQWDRYTSIVNQFDSYTELSRGGKGAHIWIYGAVGRGFRRDGVEVYSQERFIISTGKTLLARPLRDNRLLLANLVSRMVPAPTEFHLEELPEREDDWAVLETAFNASNSDKFIALWQGKWQDLGFPSQSEADLALMSMFTFYSPSNEQCRRLFRDSQLGKREKAVRDNRYINLTLTTIREREAREQRADISMMVLQAEQFAEAARTSQQRASAEIQRLTGVSSPMQEFGIAKSRSEAPLHIASSGAPALAPAPESVQLAALAPVAEGAVLAGEQGLPWPPGFTGHIARYVFSSAPRPVKEVAVVAALGLLAGICGKAWHIPKSGLNLYVILVAKSAIGKEAMHNGISEITKACKRENPAFEKFIDFTEYASGPALIKACVANPCFVNVSGEWGRKLKRLGLEDGRDGPLQTLRTQMTNLYQKSGPTSMVGGIGYSATDNNVASVGGVSYSMIGETTPGTFYDSLTESMMEDGFMSRFLVIEYDGLRPEPNKLTLTAPDEYTKQALNSIAQQADAMTSRDYSQLVSKTEEARLVMEQFERECDDRINGTNDESRRQMWNRAALKSLRVAALLAVADNWMTPCITLEQIQWAQLVVRNDIAIMGKRLDSGEVGQGDTTRERKVVSVMRDYLSKPVPSSYKVPEAMRLNSIVPRSYLQIRTQKASAFNNHKAGSNRALDEAIASMLSSGYILEAQKDKIAEAYNFHGKAYRILRLPDSQSEDSVD